MAQEAWSPAMQLHCASQLANCGHQVYLAQVSLCTWEGHGTDFAIGKVEPSGDPRFGPSLGVTDRTCMGLIPIPLTSYLGFFPSTSCSSFIPEGMKSILKGSKPLLVAMDHYLAHYDNGLPFLSLGKGCTCLSVQEMAHQSP